MSSKKKTKEKKNYPKIILLGLVLILVLVVIIFPFFDKGGKKQEFNIYSYEEFLNIDLKNEISNENLSKFMRNKYGEPIKDNSLFEVYKIEECIDEICSERKIILNKKKNKIMISKGKNE